MSLLPCCHQLTVVMSMQRLTLNNVCVCVAGAFGQVLGKGLLSRHPSGGPELCTGADRDGALSGGYYPGAMCLLACFHEHVVVVSLKSLSQLYLGA